MYDKIAEEDNDIGSSTREYTMLMPTLLMGVFALALFFLAYWKGIHVKGMTYTLKMAVDALPLLVFAFIAIGMMQVVVPKDGLSHWVGAESGFKGIILGTIAGALTPGGSLVGLAVMGGLFRSGADIGTLVAFMTSWSIWGITRLPLEVGLLGWRFTLVRLLSTAIFPIIGGFVAKTFFSWVVFE